MHKKYEKSEIDMKGRIGSKTFRSFFRSSMLMIPISVILLVLLELASFLGMENMAADFEQRTAKRVLNQVDQNFSQVSLLMSKLKNNEVVTSYIQSQERDYYEETQIFHELQITISGYNNIEEIYLYFPQYEYVISTSHGGKESLFFQQSNYQGSYEEWQESIKSGWRGNFQTLTNADGEIRNIVTTMITAPKSENTVQAVAQMSNTYLLDILDGLSLRGGEQAFVLSENGLVASTLENQSDEIAQELQLCYDEGEKSVRIEKTAYRLEFYKSAKTGLILVYATPKGASYSAMSFMRIFGMTLSLLGVVALTILAFLIASRNYQPIRYLLDHVKDADQELMEGMDDLNELELYVKRNIHTRDELGQKLKKYEEDLRLMQLGRILFQGEAVAKAKKAGMDLDYPGSYFAVLMCIFEGAEEGVEVESADLSDARREIFEEYVRENFSEVEFSLLTGKDGYFFILNGDGVSKEEFRQRLSDARDQMKESMAKDEQLFCDFYLSKGVESLDEIHACYDEVRQKKQNKTIQDDTQENESCSIERIVELIRNKLSDVNLSVNGIAEQMEVTPSHLSRYFKNKMGVGVLEYIHGCRVEQAKQMLKDLPDIRIREVAEETGFFNITTFIRVFKKIEGITPGQYRELLEKGEQNA